MRSRLSAHTRALLYLGSWSLLGLVKDKDVKPDLEGEEQELEEGWDDLYCNLQHMKVCY